MKILTLLFLSFMVINSHASEPSNEQRCQEWAVMDGISKEDMKDYLKECIYSLELPEEELSSEEEFITAELSDQESE